MHADALAFNTFMSPNTKLPSLGNLDPTIATSGYEQYNLEAESWDVAGFRFNIDSVSPSSRRRLPISGMDLGGATPKEWLLDSHPCIKVRITAGETDNIYKPDGGAQLSLSSDPRKDRHIARATWHRSRSPSRAPSRSSGRPSSSRSPARVLTG